MIAGFDRVGAWCYDQPELLARMLEIVTAREIDRIRHGFAVMGEQPSRVSLADDYAPFLSAEMYEQFVLPYQKAVRDAFGPTVEFHSCIPAPHLLRHWRDELRISVFNGFKPRSGLAGLRDAYAPVAAVFGNTIVLEPDLDGANVMLATRPQLAEATRVVCAVFAPGRGLKVGATLCGGHRDDDLEKLNAIREAIDSLP
jgi:uroporphyrinogen-III decarboxylase